MTTSWTSRAACHGIDPSVFFPVEDEDAEAAKQICQACPVRLACLDHALGQREWEGIWGGCTERERRRIVRRQRRLARVGTTGTTVVE